MKGFIRQSVKQPRNGGLKRRQEKLKKLNVRPKKKLEKLKKRPNEPKKRDWRKKLV